MPTDSGERRAAARAQTMAAMGLAPAEQQLPCPRCDSVNTKFCYYNNYNLSQPRHFCKACRRYWTHGGTLRNVPVGGATRKNSKRSRSSSSSSAAAANQPASSGSSSGGSIHDPRPANSSSSSALEIQMPPAAAAIHGDASVNGSFTSLLSSTQGGSSGFLALGGLGLGLGSGLEEMGFGLGREVWAYPEVGAVVDGAGGGLGGCGGGASENAPVGWQLGGGSESGFGEADCAFAWPDLAISMSAKGFQ